MAVRSYMGWMLVAGGLIATAPQRVVGQEFAVMSADQVSSQKTQRDRTKQLLTYKATNATVDEVLTALAQKAGIGMIVDRSSVKLDKRISVDLKSVPLQSALKTVSSKSEIRVQLSPDRGAILVLGGQAGQTAKDGTLTGTVLHATTKEPIAAATISVDGVAQAVTTGNDGRFQIPLKAGEYRIRIRAIGMAPQAKTIVVAEGQTMTIEVALQPSASILSEVVVTGTVVATERRAISTPITVVTAEDIEKRGITRVDELFRGEIPGLLAIDQGSRVYMDSAGLMASSQMYSRGSSSLDGGANPIKTYVDGVELLDPSYIGTIDPQSIERIEIITGPQAATIYGSGAMGGVMQIFTKKGQGKDHMEISINLRYGLLQSNLASSRTPKHDNTVTITGGTGPGFSYSINGSYNYVGQWQPGLFNRRFGASIGMNHRRSMFVFSGVFAITAGANGTIPNNGDNTARSTPWYRSKIESGDFFGDVIGGSGTAPFLTQRVSRSRSKTASMSVDYSPLTAWQHHLTLGVSDNKFDIKPQAPQHRSPLDTLYEVRGSQGSRTTLGYNTTFQPAARSMITSSLTLGGNGSVGEQMAYSGCTASAVSSSFRVCNRNSGSEIPPNLDISRTMNSRSEGGFGSLRIGAFDAVYLTVGLRAERNPTYGENHKIDWTPTYGIAYSVEFGSLTMKALGSYGRATRPPGEDMRLGRLAFSAAWDPSEYWAQLESPLLRPEVERGAQGGLEIYYGNIVSFTVNHYIQRVKDLIVQWKVDSTPRIRVRDGLSGFFWEHYQYINVGEIAKRGWEGTASLSVGPVNVKGTYSWNDSRLLRANPSVDYAGGRMFINGVPSHTANLVLNYARGATTVTLVNNVVGAALRTSESRDMMPQAYIETYQQFMVRSRMYIDRANLPFPSLEFVQQGYMKSNLVASHRLNSSVSLTANITNLTNSYNSEVSVVYPTLGRQTTFGVSLRFPRR